MGNKNKKSERNLEKNSKLYLFLPLIRFYKFYFSNYIILVVRLIRARSSRSISLTFVRERKPVERGFYRYGEYTSVGPQEVGDIFFRAMTTRLL